jgi:hypothetical protein
MSYRLQKYIFDILRADALFRQFPVFIAGEDAKELTNGEETFIDDEKAIENALATHGIAVAIYPGLIEPNPQITASYFSTTTHIPIYYERDRATAQGKLAQNYQIPALIERTGKLMLRAALHPTGSPPDIPARPTEAGPGLPIGTPIPVEDTISGGTCASLIFTFHTRTDTALEPIPPGPDAPEYIPPNLAALLEQERAELNAEIAAAYAPLIALAEENEGALTNISGS